MAIKKITPKKTASKATKKVAKKTTKKATRKRVSKKTRETCFVIMPFGDWFDDYYTSIYSPGITSAGLDPHRADDLYRPSAIVNDIWEYTKKAKIIVADLTNKNPNVFYELGLAHACGKPVILLTESLEDVPFDLRALRIIEYDKNDPNWGTSLKAQLKNAIQETLSSPLSTVLPTFLDEKELAKQTKELTQDQKQIISLQQEMESLKREIRTSRTHSSARTRRELSPEQAKSLIKDLVKAKHSTGEIVEMMSNLGPPERWIVKEIDRLT